MEMSDLNNSWRNAAKTMAELYLENSEKMAHAMLDFHEKSTGWAKNTVLEPLFNAQRSAGKQIFENSTTLARKLFGVEKVITRDAP